MFWSFATCVVGFGWMDLLTGDVTPVIIYIWMRLDKLSIMLG